MDNKNKKSQYNLSFIELLEGTSFDYNRLNTNIGQLDSRVIGIMAASGALITVIATFLVFFENSWDSKVYFFISLLFSSSSFICSIISLFPRVYRYKKNCEGISIERTNNVEIPTMKELENHWRGNKYQIIRQNLMNIQGQMLILGKKIVLVRYSILLFMFAVISLAIAVIFIVMT